MLLCKIHQAVALFSLLVMSVVFCKDDVLEEDFGPNNRALWNAAGSTTNETTIPSDAHINGMWSRAAPWPIVPIHMVLLPTGKILSYGTNPQASNGQGFYYDVWDPTLGLFDPNAHHTLPTTTVTNIFCSGQVIVPATAEVLITGGSQTIKGAKNYGVAHAQLFDSISETLQLAKHNMTFSRWYPTVTTLSNGR